MKDWVMIRLSKPLVDKIRGTAAQHPLKPRLRSVIERGIELMIENLERETNDGRK